MPFRRALCLAVLAAATLVSGCEDVPMQPDLGPPVSPAPTAAPATPGPSPSPSEAPEALFEDQRGFEVRVFYVTPADGAGPPEGARETTARTVAGWNAWFEDQTGGRRMRVARQDDEPEVVFFTSARPGATIAAMGVKALDAVDREVREAGYNHPLTLHAYYYDGPIDLPADGAHQTLGVGGSGRAMVFLKQFEPALVSRRERGVGPLEWTMAHEIVHALGFVGECAPNRASDAHVTDDEADLMAAASRPGLFPVLDRGRDDYYGHGKPGCLDLARTVYFEPSAPDAEPPADAPAALSAGPGALRVMPAWTPETFAGRPAVESRLLQMLNEARAEAGHPALAAHPALSAIARRRARHFATAGVGGPDPMSIDDQRRQAGYTGSMRGGGVSLGLAGGESDAAALQALETARTRGLGASLRELASDAEAREAGVGAWVDRGQLFLAYMAGHAEFEVAGVRLGEGPYGTYVLTGRARYRGEAEPAEVRVSVGDSLYRTGAIRPGRAWFPFAASVPREGRHSVTLMVRKEGDRFAGPASLFELDGSRPLAEAVVAAPAPVE